MRGRAKAEHERTIVLAHQIEAMARRKILRDVSFYLKPREKKSAQNGAASVLALFKRFKEKQDAKASAQGPGGRPGEDQP